MWTIEQAFIEIDTLRKRIRSVAGSLSGYVKTTAIKNNLTTTAAGNVLDARQGKAIKTITDGAVTGDSETFIAHVGGYFTDAGKAICFTVPINKVILGTMGAEYNTAAVTLTALQVFQTGSLFNYNDATALEAVTATATISGAGITCIVRKADSTAFANATNNNPCAVRVAGSVAFSTTT